MVDTATKGGGFNPSTAPLNQPLRQPQPSLWDQLMRGLLAPGGMVNNPYGTPSNAGIPFWMTSRPTSAPPSGAAVGSMSALDMLQASQAHDLANPSAQGQAQQPVDQQVQAAVAQGFRTDPNNPQVLYGPDGTPYAITANGIVPVQDPAAIARLQGQQAQDQLRQQGENANQLANTQGNFGLAETGLKGQQAVTLQDLLNQGQINLAGVQGQNQLNVQNAQNAGSLATTALTTASAQAIQQLQSDGAQKIAQLQADTSLSLGDKETQRTQITQDMNGKIAEINANSLLQAHQVDAELGRYKSNLEAQGVQLQEQTKRAIGDQNYDVALKNLATMSQIEHEKRIIDEETNNLNAFKANLENQTAQRGQNVNLITSVLGLQSAERQQRTKSAVDFFGQLAQLAPQQNLVNSFFSMRGQAPPPSLASQAIPQLSAIMGLTPQQTGAITSASGINNSTFAPFVGDLLGLKAAPAGAPAGA